MNQSTRTIADACKIPYSPEDSPVEIARVVRLYLHRYLFSAVPHAKWCVIIDGADDYERFCGEHEQQGIALLPIGLAGPESGFALFTTRHEAVAKRMSTIPIKAQKVDRMSGKEALVLYQMKFQPRLDDGMWRIAGRMVQSLDFNPEAITRADTWRRQNPMQPLVEFMNPIRLGDFAVSKLPGIKKEARSQELESAALHVWDAAFNQLEEYHPTAAVLLFLMSMFDDVPIPAWMLQLEGVSTEGEAQVHSKDYVGGRFFSDWSVEHHDSLGIDLVEDAKFLANGFLITCNIEDGTFEMHTLVQAAARRRLKAMGQLKKYQQEYIARLARALPSKDYRHFAGLRRCWTHFARVLDYPQEDDTAQLQRATVLHSGAWLTMTVGHYEAALELVEEAITIRRALLGPDHEMTLESQNKKALLLCYMKKFSESQALQEATLEKATELLGKDHRVTLDGMNNLAPVYWYLGRSSEVLELIEDVGETRKRTLGHEHEDSLSSMGMRAHVYWVIERYDDAERLASQVIDTRRRLSGDKHPNYLSTVNTLASVYCDTGRHANAEEMLLPAVEIMKKVLGETHPETMCGVLNLATAYGGMSRWKESEVLREFVLETLHLRANLSYEPTFSVFNRLLKLQVTTSAAASVIPIEQPFMNMIVKVLGEDHFEKVLLLETMTKIRKECIGAPDYTRVEMYEMMALATMITTAGESNPTTLNWMDSLARTRYRLGKKDEAFEMLQKCAELRKKLLGPEHDDTLKSVATLEGWERQRRRWSWRKFGRSKK